MMGSSHWRFCNFSVVGSYGWITPNPVYVKRSRWRNFVVWPEVIRVWRSIFDAQKLRLLLGMCAEQTFG